MKRTLINFYKTLSGNSEILAAFSLLFLTFIIVMPRFGHGGDIWCWGQWTKYMFQNGLGQAYKSGSDYMPLYQYVLFLFGKFQGSIERIDHNINSLKIITLIFDFIAGYLLILLLRTRYDKYRSIFYSVFFFLNISYFYNTLIWCQVDGIMACLIFAAFFFALRSNVLLSLVFVILSINFKLQSIIFIPLLAFMLLPEMVKQFSARKLVSWIMIPLLLQTIIILPFLLAGDIERVWNVVRGSVGKYPVVSMNAYNFWYCVVRGNLMEIKDSTRFAGITYKQWGLLLFFVSSFITLLPLLRSTVSRLFCRKKQLISLEKLLITATLIPMLFFFFNTQMHERYMHPALLFLAAYAILYRKFFPYILGSLAYFLNLEGVLQYLQLKNYGTAIFHPIFVASLLAICMGYLFFQMFRRERTDAQEPSQRTHL